ncbi:MAG: family 10 glycosylhydrolase [Pseudomonadota bacterium]
MRVFVAFWMLALTACPGVDSDPELDASSLDAGGTTDASADAGSADAPLADLTSSDTSSAVDATATDLGGLTVLGLRVEPASLRLAPGMSHPLRVLGQASGSQEFDVTDRVSWSVLPSTVASVASGEVLALAAGQAELVASLDGVDSPPCALDVLPPESFEARGVWVTRWNYSTQAHVQQIVAQLAAAGVNQMYFQVRGAADAYYASTLEPWADRLSGTLGQDPGWDPLRTAISEAHAVGIEVHAWINTFPAWSCGVALPSSSGVPHILETHPEWVVVDSSGTSMLGNCTSGYVTLSPGIPEVRAHLAAVAEEILTQYDVDGLHLDYIRYPGRQFSHDAVSEALFAEAQALDSTLTWDDWQRRQVNATVRDIFEVLLGVRPSATLSAAVWGIYRNIWGWSSVSQGVVDYYQDSRAWTAGRYIDAIVPMIYWPLTDPLGQRLDFATLIADHVDNNPGRQVLAGIEANYTSFDEITNQVEATRAAGAPGTVLFAYTYLQDRSYWDELEAGPFAGEAWAPLRPWRW